MAKKILLSIASIFLLFQSYKLVGAVIYWEIYSWGVLIVMAWVLNMFITGIFAFSGFAFPTQKSLPNSYYKIYRPKRLKKVYKVMGVELFRQMLLATLWKRQKDRKRFFDGTKNGISNLEEQSMKSEFGHLIPFIILILVSIYFIAFGLMKLGVLTFLINFLGNFYPIILQRHHRMRIQILRKRQQRTTAAV